jgi:hypothetical protein
MANAREWALEIDREWAETMGGIHRAVVYVATEALAKVQTKSPVDTGQFKSNWLVSVGRLDPSTQEGAGSAFAAKSSAALSAYAAAEGFPAIYLQNNLKYAGRLEDGYSRQAPSGMVALTVAELAAMWNSMKIP